MTSTEFLMNLDFLSYPGMAGWLLAMLIVGAVTFADFFPDQNGRPAVQKYGFRIGHLRLFGCGIFYVCAGMALDVMYRNTFQPGWNIAANIAFFVCGFCALAILVLFFTGRDHIAQLRKR